MKWLEWWCERGWTWGEYCQGLFCKKQDKFSMECDAIDSDLL